MLDIRLTVRRKERWQLEKDAELQYLEEWMQRLEKQGEYNEASKIRHKIHFGQYKSSYDYELELSKVLHIQRAELLHSLVDQLSLQVESWGYTDDKEPHETVDIILALGSADIITAIVNIIKLWLEKDKIQKASISLPNGTKLEIERATAEEIKSFIALANQIQTKEITVAEQPIPKKKKWYSWIIR